MQLPDPISGLQYSLAARRLAQQNAHAFAAPIGGALDDLAQRKWQGEDRAQARSDAGLDAARQVAMQKYVDLGNWDMVYSIATAETPEKFQQIEPLVGGGYGQETMPEKERRLRMTSMERTMPDKGGITPYQGAVLGQREEEAKRADEAARARLKFDVTKEVWDNLTEREKMDALQKYRERMASVAEGRLGLARTQDDREANADALIEQIRLQAEARAAEMHPLQKKALETLIEVRKKGLENTTDEEEKKLLTAIKILASMGRAGGGVTFDPHTGRVASVGGGSRPAMQDDMKALAKRLFDLYGFEGVDFGLESEGGLGDLGLDPGVEDAFRRYGFGEG